MQESVDVYERLGLKSEYMYAYRMLIFLLCQAGNFNALSRELTKFHSCEDIVAAQPILVRLWRGQSPNDLEREKGII